MHTAGFNASTDGGVQDNGALQAANGITGMVWVDAYDNSTCTQTMTNSAIAAMVQANVTAGNTGLRYEIGDEPTTNGCNAAPVYASITQAVHGADTTAKTWTADDQFQTGAPIQAGVPMKGSVDILAFDVYPCESGPCDYSAIDSAVQQIHAANVTNWEFILQDFSSSPWRWPTPTEIQTQFDHWKNQGAIGYWVYAWDYQGQQVIQQAGNVAALQSINSQAINGSASSLNVSIAASATTGDAPLAVNFTSTPSGGVPPYSYAWAFGDGAASSTQNPSHSYTVAGNYSANLTVTDSVGTTASATSVTITVNSQPTTGSPGVYTAMAPVRVLDTRGTGGTLGPGASVNLTIGAVPANATAVVLNITAVNESAPGNFVVYPTGYPIPLASNLNWAAHETVPNLVVVGLGLGGQVTIANGNGTADAVVDLEGYFAPSSGSTAGEFVPVVPARITDTRPTSGQANAGATLMPNTTLNVQVTGAGGIPGSGVTAVVMNVTATGTSSAGFFTVFPTGGALPNASNLNWTAGMTVPNRVIVPVGANGQVSVYNGLGKADLIVDVNGYFTDGTGTGASFTAINPTRIVDTRNGTGGFSSQLGPNSSMPVTVAGNAGVPANATAVVLNVTVTGPTAASDLTVWPYGASLPLASDLNFAKGQTVPNLVVVKLSAGGASYIRNDFGATDVIVDVVGWYG